MGTSPHSLTAPLSEPTGGATVIRPRPPSDSWTSRTPDTRGLGAEVDAVVDDIIRALYGASLRLHAVMARDPGCRPQLAAAVDDMDRVIGLVRRLVFDTQDAADRRGD